MSARTRTAARPEPPIWPLTTRSEALLRQVRADAFAALPVDALLTIGAIALALAVSLALNPYGLRLGSDGALFLHYGRRILDGDVPYRDFFDHKTPLISYFNAGAVWIAGLLHQDPIEVMHIAHLAVGGAVAAATFGLGRSIFGSRAIGIAAVAMLVGFAQFATWVALGSSPKLLMLACGLGAWLAALHRRHFVAGLLAALAALAWQPGVVFAAVCAVAAAGDLASRAAWFRAARAFGCGFGLPLLMLGAHFAAAGALDDTFLQLVVFNRDYIEAGARAPADLATHMAGLQARVYGDQWVAWLGVAGGAAALVPGLLASARGRAHADELVPRMSLAGAWSLVTFAALVVAVALVNTGGETDLVFFLPLLTLLPACSAVALARAAAADWRAIGWVRPFATFVSVALVAAYALGTGIEAPGGQLSRQSAAMDRIASAATLAPGDEVLALGAFAFAALEPYPNIARYPYTYSQVPRFVAGHDPDGLAHYKALAVEHRPKLILYERQPLLAGFTAWLEARYVRCLAPAIRRTLEVPRHPVEMWLRADVARDNSACNPPRTTRVAVAP